MGALEALASKASVKVRYVGALRLIPSSDARRLLEVLRQERVLVMGIEGFRLDNDRPVPDMGAILDLSGVLDVDEAFREARGFVNEIAAPDLFVDFVLRGDQ